MVHKGFAQSLLYFYGSFTTFLCLLSKNCTLPLLFKKAPITPDRYPVSVSLRSLLVEKVECSSTQKFSEGGILRAANQEAQDGLNYYIKRDNRKIFAQ